MMISNKSWDSVNKILNEDWFKETLNKLDLEYKNNSVLPAKKHIYRAFELVDFDDVRVVILGQDPYPNKEHAMGLSFSVEKDSQIPKSLSNIFIEYSNDLGFDIPSSGDLTSWAKNGVLLLKGIEGQEK